MNIYHRILTLFFLFRSISAVDFVLNGFNSSNLLLYGNATIEQRVLTLTNHTNFSIGRALYKSKIPAKDPISSQVYPFSTSFIFSMALYKDAVNTAGHGFVFIFTPFTGIDGTNPAQHLGLFNFTNNGNSSNHVFGVEFDVFANQEFADINNNHVGVDLNSLKSINSSEAGYWVDGSLKKLKLNNGKNYQVWIDYSASVLNVTMAIAGMERPKTPLLNLSLNLSDVFEDEMYVGFTAATGRLLQSHKILSWSFSNTKFSLSESLLTSGLPSFVLPKPSVFKSKGFIAGITIGSFFFLGLCVLFSVLIFEKIKRKQRERDAMEDWELEYWPHRLTYQEIETATKGFAEENVIGIGGNGKVYKGVLPLGAEIAVKRISHDSDEGMREFVAEVSSLGRLKHRSLVGFRGWCKREKGNFMLVYDYMENGSLDRMLFSCEENKMLSYEDRIRILKDVAMGVLYLHEGWESKVLHRDIKSSNVLLDKDMNGRLGDFGLARIHGHGQVASTTRIVGTVGYLAPEIIRSGRASTQTDVFGFGILILEVICGRRPIEEGEPPLVDLLWKLMSQGKLLDAIDTKLKEKGGFDEEEVERVLRLGLLCAYFEPSLRPTMRQTVMVLEGKKEGSTESESESIDMYLLMKSTSLRSNLSQSSGYGSHPTFDDIMQSLSSSMSLSWSNTSAANVR